VSKRLRVKNITPELLFISGVIYRTRMCSTHLTMRSMVTESGLNPISAVVGMGLALAKMTLAYCGSDGDATYVEG
jgi:hypothetical protein